MKVTTIGLDIAKSVFQVHGEDCNGKVVVQKRLRRSQVVAWFSQLPRSLIGIEACGTAHYWARTLRELGHDVRLIPAAYVKPFVRRNKNAMRAMPRRSARRSTVRTCALSRSRASSNRPRAGWSARVTFWSSSARS